MPSPDPAAEPKPLTGAIQFEEGDFHVLEERLAGDAQFNDRRLVARRKLLALGKQAVKRIAAHDLKLEVRSSLHNPHAFNQNRVRKLWASLFRSKADKQKLKKVLGADLAKDLDSAHRNACIVVGIDADSIRVSFEIAAEAWYDGQNMKKRIAAEGLDEWRRLLDERDGYRLHMHDWKGEWRCGSLTADKLQEFLGYYVPGDHRLKVERVWPATGPARAAVLGEGVTETLLDELEALVPLYRWCAWSKESEFLFG